jgi:copper homeostasis protein
MLIEVPVGNIESVIAAKNGGADRIELCSALPLGGLTPTTGMLAAISTVPITKFVMIRPREGDFVFSTAEFRSMLHDIDLFSRNGAQGFVSGVLRKNGTIDVERTKELIEACRPLPFTFHRAFDLTPDPFHALDVLIALQVDRLLTSGQSADAFSGRQLISKLVKRSENKILIIAGAGINPVNVKDICQDTGVKEIHLSGRMRKTNEMTSHSLVRLGNIEDENHFVTDESIVRSVRKIVDKIIY